MNERKTTPFGDAPDRPLPISKPASASEVDGYASTMLRAAAERFEAGSFSESNHSSLRSDLSRLAALVTDPDEREAMVETWAEPLAWIRPVSP